MVPATKVTINKSRGVLIRATQNIDFKAKINSFFTLIICIFLLNVQKVYELICFAHELYEVTLMEKLVLAHEK